MYWDVYWSELIEKKKLSLKVEELNQMDALRGNSLTIEQICHKIYDDYYNEWRPHLDEFRQQFIKLIDNFEGVHLQTNRIKTIDSLLVKIITKRHGNIGNPNSMYSKIDGDNYKNIVTDLIGLRLIINYRGKWQVIHKELIDSFPYVEEAYYKKHKLIPNDLFKENVLAEIPTVYYAIGDNIDAYSNFNMIAKQHGKGYRSIHYVVIFMGVYIEIQIRTIYDEAWSDCDHSYVYKQDENKSHTALESLSQILCQLTNIANDMGENMREIFESEKMIDQGDGTWKTSKECIESFDQALNRVKLTYQKLETFRGKLKY